MNKERVIDICRWVLGGVFSFSGIVKCVDPVGTAVFVEKYLVTFSLDVLLPLALPIAIVLSVVEFSLGQLLLNNKPHRITAIATIVIMSLFTIVTLLNATVLPIGDCGCFGDAIRLTPVQTLLKNIVLMPLSVLMIVGARRGGINYIALFVPVLISLGVSLYSLRYQPIIDFMPYDKSTNLREEVSEQRAQLEKSATNILIFKDKRSGHSVEFDASNIECWSDPNLEYVDSRRVTTNDKYLPLAELVVADAAGQDLTLELLERSGRVAWVTIYDDVAFERYLNIIKTFVESHSYDSYIVVTSLDAERVSEALGVECYQADAMTLRTMNRSKAGVIVLDNGVIAQKSDIRDI